MKKLIAFLLALMLALALAVPASAAGEDIGIIGGADGPTYILVSADPEGCRDGFRNSASRTSWPASAAWPGRSMCCWATDALLSPTRCPR